MDSVEITAKGMSAQEETVNLMELRDNSILRLRLIGYVEDLSEKTDEQLSNMIKGFEKKGGKQQYVSVCPYFIGVSHLSVYDWKIGCTQRNDANITPYEQKGWACNAALRCLVPKLGKGENFTSCRFFCEAREKEKNMKQKYICKCGKTFEKDGTSDTTGYRLGLNYGPDNECYGCHFIVPVTPAGIEVVDYECRASKKIDYQTTADLPRSREGFHVGRIRTLDMEFARQVWEFSRTLGGQDDHRSEMDVRSASYGADGRYELTLYVQKTKAGIASSIAVSDKFFGGGTVRPGIAPGQEKQLVLQQIRQSKENAKSAPAQLTSPADGPVSNGMQDQRSIDQITLEINFYKVQTAQNIIEIGKRLIEAKQQMQHGEWIPWLKDKVEFTERSAQNFMKIAQEYSKTQPVSFLPYTKLLALLQVPDAEREEFLQETHLVDGQEKTVSEMSKRELQQAIKERDEAQLTARLIRERCDKAEKAATEAREGKKKEYDNYMGALVKAEKAEETLKTLRGSRQFDLQRITEMEEQIRELESRPVEVAVQQLSEADKQKLREEGAANAESQAERTRRVYESRLNEALRQLEEAKNQARQDAGLEPNEIVAAAASFRDSMDSIFDNFQLILRVSPGKTINVVVRDCIGHLKGLISELEDAANMIRNVSLADEVFELPPADGREE